MPRTEQNTLLSPNARAAPRHIQLLSHRYARATHKASQPHLFTRTHTHLLAGTTSSGVSQPGVGLCGQTGTGRMSASPCFK